MHIYARSFVVVYTERAAGARGAIKVRLVTLGEGAFTAVRWSRATAGLSLREGSAADVYAAALSARAQMRTLDFDLMLH